MIFKFDLASGMQNQSTSPLLYIPIISSSTPGQLVSSQSFCRAQVLCESRGGRPGLPIPNSPYGLCGRKVTLNLNVQ